MTPIRRWKPALHGLVLGLTVAGLTTCSLEPASRETELRIDLSRLTEEYRRTALTDPSLKTAPSAISGFNCLGVNIVGPGIPDNSPNPKPNLPSILSGLLTGSPCTYRGVVAGPILPVAGTYGPSELTLMVPAGANRVIQVFGIVDSRAGAPSCAPGPGFAHDAANVAGAKPDFYEIGRAQLDLMTVQSVSIANAWPPGGDEGRKMNCEDSNSASLTVNIIPGFSSPTSSINWPISASVSGTYDQYCWQENDTNIANCSWTVGSFPTSIAVGGGDGTKVVSFWARDSVAGITSSRFDLGPVILDTAPPTVAIIQPSGGGTVTSPYVIQWVSADANVLPPGAVTIDYSTDSGATWTNLVSSMDDLGAYNWVPVVATSSGRLKITIVDAAGNVGNATTTSDFTIIP